MKNKYLLYDFGEYEDREYWLVETPERVLKQFKSLLKKDMYQEPVIEIDNLPKNTSGIKKTTCKKYLKKIIPTVMTEKKIRESIRKNEESWKKIIEETKGGGITGHYIDLDSALYWNEQKKKQKERIKELLHLV